MHPVTRVVPSIEVGTTSTGDFVSHDHRISQSFKCVVQLAEAIEPKQQAPELVFPTEQPLDRIAPLFEDGGIEERLAASLWCFAATGVWIDQRPYWFKPPPSGGLRIWAGWVQPRPNSLDAGSRSGGLADHFCTLGIIP